MEDEFCGMLEGELIDVVQGGGGTSYYPDLVGLPSINGVTLVGDKTSEELGLVQDEEDPTVPEHVKAITEQDVANWNNKAEKNEIPTKVSQLQNDEGFAKESYVDTKVADLVNSAPETLNTLGELAKAIEDNKDLIDAIKVPTKTSELENDSGFITAEDIPDVDLSGLVTNDTLNTTLQDYALKSELPTKTSELTNDSGFITLEDIPEVDVDLSNYYTKDETYSKAEVNTLLGTNEANLLKVSPVITDAINASTENPYPQSVKYLVDENEEYYKVNIEVGKTYIIEYIVNDVTYIQEDVAIDSELVVDDLPQLTNGFSLGVKAGFEGLNFSFTTADGREGGLYIKGGFALDSAFSVVRVIADGSVPSVKIVSIKEKVDTNYYTKAETQEYVQSVVGDINTALDNILGV